MLTPTLILSYYSVIGGWSMDFLLRACRFEFVRMAPDALRDVFPTFISSPWKPLVAHTVLLAVTAVIVGGAWLIAPGKAIDTNAVTTPGDFKLADAVLYITYLLVGGAIVTLIWSAIRNAVKK